MTVKELPDRPDCPTCGVPMSASTKERWRCRICRYWCKRELSPGEREIMLEKQRERYHESKQAPTLTHAQMNIGCTWYRCERAPEDGLYRVGQLYRSDVVLTDKRERVDRGYKFLRPDGKVVQW